MNTSSQVICDYLVNGRDHTETNLCEEIIRHGATNIAEAYLQNQLSKPSYKRLTEYNKALAIKLAFLDKITVATLSELKKHHIDLIVIKGFALAHTVYKSPYHRQRSDVDILIRPKQVDTANQVLAKLGFYNPRGWIPQQAAGQFSMVKSLSNGLKLNIDVHFHISSFFQIKNWITFASLSQEKISTNNVAIISKPYCLVHSLIHIATNHYEKQPIKLMWLYDIYLLVECLDCEEQRFFVEYVDAQKLGTLVHHFLSKTNAIFTSEKMVCLINSLLFDQKETTNYDFLLIPTSRQKRLIREFKARGWSRDMLVFAREVLFPPRGELESKYGNVNQASIFFAYAKRIIFGVFRK